MFSGVACRLLIELVFLSFSHVERQLGEKYRITCEGRKNKMYLQLLVVAIRGTILSSCNHEINL